MNALATTYRAIVVHAEDSPLADTPGTQPNHRYRHPRASIETRPLGELGDDCIRVEMMYVGVCGTDLHLLQSDPATGYVRTSAPATIPHAGRIIGHEGVGRVAAVGKSVTGTRPGDLVAFASIFACMRCEICLRGACNQCLQALLLGMELDGLFTTVADVPASLAQDVSGIAHNEAGLQAAACIEPAGCALLACENARVARGDRVVVFGGGPIGLFAAMASKRVHAATHVTLVEPVPARRERASAWCDAVSDVEAFLDGPADGIDVVIECSGNLDNINRVFRRMQPGGRIVLLGRNGTPLAIDAVDHMITNAVSVSGSRGHLGGALSRAIELHAVGALPLTAAISGTLDSLDALLGVLRRPEAITQAHCKLLTRVR